VLLVLRLFDYLLGHFLFPIGYFYAMNPEETVITETSEFKSIAKISAQGLRNELVAIPKPHGVYRILALGDSFTYGWAVSAEETWVKQAESALFAKGKKVEVINAGVPGIGTTQEVEICRAYADQFDVDMILLGFYGTDDLLQNSIDKQNDYKNVFALSQYIPTLLKLGNPMLIGAQGSKQVPKEPIYKRFIWEASAKEFAGNNPNAILQFDPVVREWFMNGLINPDLLLSSLQNPRSLVTMLEPERLDSAINTSQNILQNLLKECARKRPVVFLLLAAEELVSEDYLRFRTKSGFIVDKRLVTLDLDTPMANMVRNNGISFISVFPSFRADTCPGCFYPWDIHLTPYGNKRVSDVIAPLIDTFIS